MKFDNIKLIIWDLDETLWHGILSDGEISFPKENIQLIKDATDCGVVCSICSKNDENKVIKTLNAYKLADYFVFNSINWSPKGERIKQMITEMNLRPINVLFIDDNSSNREEARVYCPSINVADVDVIHELTIYYHEKEKKDLSHERLNQYKILEEKNKFKALAGSNTEFLIQSNIRAMIGYDCEKHIDRIVDLIQRSNQLNFTKIRSTKEEINNLLDDEAVKCGYVNVVDNYGDYGIVGFYALRNDTLEHFVFSCRTLGMGIEQYVYKKIGSPKLSVVGEVSSDVNSPDPFWINSSNENASISKMNIKNSKIVLKGLCDMQQMFAYIAENKNIITEFEYVNFNGVSIEQRNHSMHVVQSLTIKEEEKKLLTKTLPFGDKDMYNTAIFNEDIGYVVYSLFTDPNMGMYRRKETGTIVAFGEYTNDLTNEKNWDKFINKELFVANCNFTRQNLIDFAKDFEFIGRISVQQIIANLDIIYNNLNKKAQLILVLGSEKEYKNETSPAYLDRHLYNKELNLAIKKWLVDKKRVYLIDMNEIATEDCDYTNNINHFTRSVYYKMTNKLVTIIENTSGEKIKQNGNFVANITHLKRKIKKVLALTVSVFKNNKY